MASPSQDLSADLVRAARRCVGQRYRHQGRGIGGTDCLGVILHALGAVGCPAVVPANYGRVGHAEPAIEAHLLAAGLTRVDVTRFKPGDILVSLQGRQCAHFALATDLGVIEAHAGARRVVERELCATDRWVSAWRLAPR